MIVANGSCRALHQEEYNIFPSTTKNEGRGFLRALVLAFRLVAYFVTMNGTSFALKKPFAPVATAVSESIVLVTSKISTLALTV